MHLKATVDKIEDVPEALQEFYTEKDGKYTLAVQGMVDKKKLDEFRDNNTKLLQDMETLEGKYSTIDMDKYNELLKRQQDGEFASLIKAGKIDELVDMKTKAVHDHYNTEMKTLKEGNSTLTRQLEGLTIDSVVRDIAAKNGVAATAVDDLLLRAKSVFKLKDGKATPFEGENVIYASGTTDPLSVEGWVKGLSDSAPHLFNDSKGVGSTHNKGGTAEGKIVTRSQFDSMDQQSRSAFAKDGGKVTD